jgi:uncharacterized protein (TIGR03437 family)
VGLISLRSVRPFFFSLFFASFVQAAPMLRLATSTVGPVSVAVGTSTSQSVEAYNAGDGALSPQLAVTGATWLGATVGAARSCVTTQAAATCIPLQFALNTSGLAAGIYTGIVTVSDASASTVDAPQTITVTVQVGGGVPASVDAYAAPGYTNDIQFTTNEQLFMQGTTKDGGSWLSVSMNGGGSFHFDYSTAVRAETGRASLALDGSGSFSYTYPYRIRLQPPAGMTPGTYNGTVTATSTFAPDNKTIPVTMRLVSQPIAQAGISQLQVTLAQGAPDYGAAIPVSNIGTGTLSIQSATTGGVSWISSAANSSTGVSLTLNPGSLAVGTYNTTVTIASNAANGSIAVPVSLQVVAKGAPRIDYQGVLDNATYVAGDTVTPGDIVIVKGEQFSFSPLTLGQAPPLAQQVGGASVLVNGESAPLFYSIYGQLAFQMPFDTALGTASVQVQRDGLTSNTVSVNVGARAPKILPLTAITGGYGIITFPDYTWALPTGAYPGVTSRPAEAGDVLTIWCIGLGPTSPEVATGAPAPSSEPLARLTATPQVNIGGMRVTPAFAGLTPTAAGLYQINVVVPPDLPSGTVSIYLEFPDSTSNSVNIPIR